MVGRIRTLLLCILLLGSTSLLHGQTQSPLADGKAGRERVLVSKLTQLGPRDLRMEYSFAPPSDSSTQAVGNQLSAPEGLDPHSIPGINLHGFSRELGIKAVRVTVESVQVREVSLPGVKFTPITDIPITDDSDQDRKAIARLRTFQTTSIYPAEWATISYKGQMGEMPVSTLDILPYRYDPQRKVVLWAERISLHIESAEPLSAALAQDISSAFARSYRSTTKRSASVLGAYSNADRVAPDGFEYKLFASTDGIYRVTAAELQNVGVPIGSIDARTFKLYNRGVEIPIYLYDRSNNRLEVGPNEEYIEFFGQQKRADSVEPGSDLYFDPNTGFNTYFLVWGGNPGKRMVEEAGDIGPYKNTTPSGVPIVDLTQNTASFLSTIHLEENNTLADLSNTNLNTYSDRVDRGMWGRITANTQVTFNTLIPQPDVLSDDEVKITAYLRGSSARSFNGSDPDVYKTHTAEILLQNHRALRKVFEGDRIAIASTDSTRDTTTNKLFETKAAILDPNGSAKITISNQYGPQASTSESFYANWFEITYPRLYAAFVNQLDFTVPRGYQPSYFTFNLKGFTNSKIRVYRTGISRIINVTFIENKTFDARGGGDSGTWRGVFQVYAASDKEKFFATTEDQIPHPLIVRDSSAELRNQNLDNDYLVIVDEVASDLAHYNEPNHPLRTFMELKRQQGFKPKLIRVTDIYDEFNFGALSPLAIRNFLAYSYRNWARPPKFVMIFGNGSPLLTIADPLLQERSFVPSILFQTKDFGAAPCDYLFGCLDGDQFIAVNKYGATNQERTGRVPDLFPEIFVGRVPVWNVEHIKAYVDKLVFQEQSRDYGEWRNRMVLIAGAESEFTNQINKFIRTELRYSSEPYRLLTGGDYINSGYLKKGDLLPVMNNAGAALVTYLGHGGGGQWEDALAFTNETVGNLHNAGRMPTILSFTCFTGALRVDYGLMSALMVQPKVGAVSGMGTASFGWLINNGLLAEGVFAILNKREYRSLSFSEILALGKAKYIGVQQNSYPDEVPTLAAMYSVFGDPSLKIPFTIDTVNLVSPFVTAGAGQTITATATLPFVPTSISASLFDTTEVTTDSLKYSRLSITPTGTTLNITETIPGNYNQAYIGVRFYAVDNNGNSVTGSTRIATSDRNLLAVHPAGAFTVSQDAYFDIDIIGTGTIDTIHITLNSTLPSAGPNVSNNFVDSAFGVVSTGTGHYRTVLPVVGWKLTPGSRVDIKVTVPNPLYTEDLLPFTFYVEGGADPSAIAPLAMDSTRALYEGHVIVNPNENTRIPNQTVHIEHTAAGPVMTAKVFNWGDRDVNAIPYEFYYYQDRDVTKRVSIGKSVVSIPARGSATVAVPLGVHPPVLNDIFLAIQPVAVSGLIDPWQDSYSGNNISRETFTVAASSFTQLLGTTMDGASHSSFNLQQIGSLDMPVQVAAGSGVITAAIERTLPATVQSFGFVMLGDSILPAQVLRLASRATPQDSATLVSLSLNLDPRDTNATAVRDLRIMRYNAMTKQWTAYPTNRSGAYTVTATVPITGLYGVAVKEDSKGPEIKYSVEGQFYDDGGATPTAVPRNARFTAVVLDPSGIDTDLDKITLLLDGKALQPGSDFVIVDSTITATTTDIRIQTDLQQGKHEISLQIADKLGNKSLRTTEFEVENDLSVKVYGNFPNPFDKETFIAFEIRGATVVDEVEVKIYTTAGKAIKTMRFPSQNEAEIVGLEKGGTGQPNSLGYHEAWWDGRDDQGNEVANGVYFYRLKVKGQDEEIENTGTIARIR